MYEHFRIITSPMAWLNILTYNIYHYLIMGINSECLGSLIISSLLIVGSWMTECIPTNIHPQEVKSSQSWYQLIFENVTLFFIFSVECLSFHFINKYIVNKEPTLYFTFFSKYTTSFGIGVIGLGPMCFLKSRLKIKCFRSHH